MEKIKKYRTDYLFTTPSFLIGMGSVLNISGKYFMFNYSPSGQEADARAIESDWGVIGDDITSALLEQSNILSDI